MWSVLFEAGKEGIVNGYKYNLSLDMANTLHQYCHFISSFEVTCRSSPRVKELGWDHKHNHARSSILQTIRTKKRKKRRRNKKRKKRKKILVIR